MNDNAPDDDGWQAYKDDLAMGRIYEDGSPRYPEPPDDAYRDDDEGPWTCESCGTGNGAADEHCLNCDRWRTDEGDPDEEEDR